MTILEKIQNLTWWMLDIKIKDILTSLFTTTESIDTRVTNIENNPSGEFIPLSGTEVGKPITGDIETNAGLILKGYVLNGLSSGGVGIGSFDDAIFSLSNSNGGRLDIAFNDVYSITSLTVSEDKGLSFGVDTSTNITDLDYTQKIYVDSLLPQIADNFADDTAAAIGGVEIGRLYHTAGVVKIRLT